MSEQQREFTRVEYHVERLVTWDDSAVDEWIVYDRFDTVEGAIKWVEWGIPRSLPDAQYRVVEVSITTISKVVQVSGEVGE